MSCSDLRERSCLAKRFAALFVLGAAVLLNACGGGGIGPAPNKTQGGVVVQPGTVGVTIIPHEVTVLTDGTVHFDAKITGTSNTAVNWTVVSGGGQIDSEGVYTAPSTPGSATIRVASAADPTSTATASITIQAAPEAELGSVVIPIVSAKIGTSQEIQLTASVVGLNVGVIWSVISGGGTITPDGVYTAPSTAGTVTLLATSSADPGRSATVSITISASPPIVVSVTPSIAEVEVMQTMQFSATVTGTTNQDVTWQVASGGGTISASGLYTAPATPGAATIRATSVADPTKSGTASILMPQPVSVGITPSSVSVKVLETVQFTATVTGTANTAVTWLVTSGGGAISSTGLYTAPAIGGHAVVEAISVAVPSESASAEITITQPIGVSITPPSVTVEALDSVQFTATVAGADDQGVTWSVDSGVGTISPVGVYTASSAGGSATVRATSLADPTKSATAAVIIRDISVAVSPSVVNVEPFETVQFTAALTGTNDPTVIWSVVSGAGTIDQGGLYTAPATAGAAVVRATSWTDAGKSATASITITQALAVIVDPTSATLEASQTQQFTATVTGSADTDVTWAVTSGGGTIDAAGLYTAPATGGSATVRATSVADPTKSASASVTIQDVTVDVAPSSASVLVNGTQQFTATVGGTSNTAVTWDVVSGGGTISAAGLYTAPGAPGAATVRATSQADSTVSATASVTISDSVAVSIDPTSATLEVSQTQQFTATVTGAADTSVTWDVISGGGSITAGGLYTAPSTGGSATVRATSVADPTKTASVTVTIQDVSVDVSPASASVLVNGTQQFTATVLGTSNTAVNWTIDSGGGSIDANTGLYTAPAAAGVAVVRATSQADPTQSATASVTIDDLVAVSIDPTSAVLQVSQTQQFTATVTGAANTAVTWDVISGGGSVDASGLYTAPTTGGSATVRATSVADNTKFATATVTIQNVIVDVAPSNASVLVNGTQQFTATVLGTSNTAVTWTMDSGGGSISPAGLYTAPGTAGVAVIRATSQADPTQSDTATITINPLITVSVDPSAVTLQVSQTQQFNATVTGSANTDVIWQVTSGGGSIDGDGLYTAPNTGGSATVRATSVADPTKSATASITIQDVTISVSPSSTGVVTSGNVQFTATVGGTSNTAVNWSIDVGGGGSIDGAGLYTAPATAGSATVRATSQADPSKSATASVTIVDAIEVFVSPTTAEVVTGTTFQFTATVLNFAANSNVNWTVQSGVGSIDATGLYTAPGATGSAVIRATSQEDGSKFAEAAVTVIEPVAVSVSPSTATVEFSQTRQFTATVTGTANTSVTWAVISGGGTVSNTGLYTAPATPGSATVRATSVADPTKNDDAVVTIVAPVAVSVSPSSTTILVDQTAQFTATVTGSGNTAVTWTIDSGGGTISTGGLYTAPGTAGSAVIRATSQADPSKSATASITINPPVAVSISPTSANLQVSQTQQFTATVTGSANTDVTWTVTSGGGTVSTTGLYTAPNTGGSATVRATSVADPTKSASASITIQSVTISVSPSSAAILVNQTQQFTATVGGTTNTAVTWTIDSGGGSINSSGLYTAPGSAGSAVIRATSQADPSKSATASITINPPVAVSISPTSANLQVSQTQLFTATVTGSANTDVTWAVTSGGGSVNSAGLYTAPNTGGSATVRATSVADPTKFASASITIQSVTISVSPSSATILVNQTQQFTATVGGTTNTAVTWTIDSGGGSINSSGLYTAPGSAGSAVIRATSQADPSKSATASVTTNQPVVVTVSPTSANLEVSEQQQFTATVTGASNTNVTWSVTSGGGSILPNGRYTAPNTGGSATVRATSVADPTKFASASITIQSVTVSVSPSSTSVETSKTVQFAATVGGTSNTAVTWSMVSGGGSISSAGLYTAPGTTGSASIRATSQADPSVSATASITIVQPVTVSVSPTSSIVDVSQSLQFTATVTGSGNTAVTWTVTNGGGTINSTGLYTAPASTGAATVTATSVADPSKSASAGVTINDPIVVNVSPESATVQASGSLQFAATVNGTSNQSVTWSVASGGGTINTSGLYTAPATTGSATVRATSVANPTKVADAAVTIVPTITVSVSPSTATVIVLETVQFTATVGGSANQSVIWTVASGSGTISSSGLYTAPANIGEATVRATSVADASKSAVATITINTSKTQDPPAITISVSPQQATVQTNGTVQFTATVTGTDNTAVNWSVVSGSGSISTGGLYTAPNNAGSATIRATSVVNPNPTADASITITAPDPGSRLLSASPDPLAFGSVTTGITSSKTLVLTNVGTLAVSVTGATVSGSGFSISGVTFPFSLAAGETRNITIQFAPQAAGSVTGSVSFSSDASNTPTMVELTGNGVTLVQHIVDLTWAHSTSVNLGYRIYRSLHPTGPYFLLNDLLTVSAFYADESVSNGVAYFYVVRAVGPNGLESAPSNEVQVVIPPD